MITNNLGNGGYIFPEPIIDMPLFMVCNNTKEDYQNKHIYEIKYDDMIYNTDANGYIRNIDIESDLFRINYYADKCDNINYKIDRGTIYDYTGGIYKQRNYNIYQAPPPTMPEDTINWKSEYNKMNQYGQSPAKSPINNSIKLVDPNNNCISKLEILPLKNKCGTNKLFNNYTR
jgi:hypothetical protein